MNTFILALSFTVFSVCLVDAVSLGGQQQAHGLGPAQTQTKGNIRNVESGLDIMFKDFYGAHAAGIKGLGAPAGVAKPCGGATTAAPATTTAAAGK